MDSLGNVTTYSSYKFQYVIDVAVDSTTRNVFVLDAPAHQGSSLYLIDANGVVSLISGFSESTTSFGFDDLNGILYVPDNFAQQINKFYVRIPTAAPTSPPGMELPSEVPSTEPSIYPTVDTSSYTNVNPSAIPSMEPSYVRSLLPNAYPSDSPSSEPTAEQIFASRKLSSVSFTRESLNVALEMTYPPQRLSIHFTFVDRNGTLFGIIDKNIYKINQTNSGVTGTATAKLLFTVDDANNGFTGATFDDIGFLYLSYWDGFIKKVDINNIYTVNGDTVIVNLISLISTSQPIPVTKYAGRIAFSPDFQYLYVADAGHNIIRQLDKNGILHSVGVSFSIGNAVSSCVDSNGNIVSSDYVNGRILSVDTSGVVTVIVSGLSFPLGVVCDSSGIYVSDSSSNNIYKISPVTVNNRKLANGNQYLYKSVGNSSSFSRLYGITVDKRGNIYTTDIGNGKIHKIAANGVVSSLYLGFQLKTPTGIGIDSNGNIYVGDSSLNTIFTVSSTNTPLPTIEPSLLPSISTVNPSKIPSRVPSIFLSTQPTKTPSKLPVSITVVRTITPSVFITCIPTFTKSSPPTMKPSILPTTTLTSVFPTITKSLLPTMKPSIVPTTTLTSAIPTIIKSLLPTIKPSIVPTTSSSSANPTFIRSLPSTIQPSILLTTVSPSIVFSKAPNSIIPTNTRSLSLTSTPSKVPSSAPTIVKSSSPIATINAVPSKIPTQSPIPSLTPTNIPSRRPSLSTTNPNTASSKTPNSIAPSIAPTQSPLKTPTSFTPTLFRSSSSTVNPSLVPSKKSASIAPTNIIRSTSPTVTPITIAPTIVKSQSPTMIQSKLPSVIPSSNFPVKVNTLSPSKPLSFPYLNAIPVVPSTFPTTVNTVSPNKLNSNKPTGTPSIGK